MKMYSFIHLPNLAAAAMALLLGGRVACTASDGMSAGWKAQAISPVANPLFFESPLIQSEARPLFLYHKISDDFIGGFARVEAVQLRYAVNDRLAVIATKDGYIQLRPRAAVPRADGWADIGVGLKYALVDDEKHQFILTPGFKFELPTGNRRVFQGNGDGEFNAFLSAMKGWGRVHATASIGGRVPVDFDKETSSLHYSFQLDCHVCQWFIPFAVVNGQTVLSEGKTTAFGVEGFDLINFGDSKSEGFTQVAVGGGFRSRLCKRSDIGLAFEKGVTSPKGLFDERFTVDLIVRF